MSRSTIGAGDTVGARFKVTHTRVPRADVGRFTAVLVDAYGKELHPSGLRYEFGENEVELLERGAAGAPGLRCPPMAGERETPLKCDQLPPQTVEQRVRDMLDRLGVENVQRFSAGDLCELANAVNGAAPTVPAAPDDETEMQALMQALTLRTLKSLEQDRLGEVLARLATMTELITRAHRLEMAALDRETTAIGEQLEEIAAGMKAEDQLELAGRLHKHARVLTGMGRPADQPDPTTKP